MVVVIDYGIGNSGSILNLLKRAGARAKLSADPADIRNAERLILPGVGAFDHGVKALRMSGLEEVLHAEVRDRAKPILGICLGMQLFTLGSEEGDLPGLGWLDAETKRFRVDPDGPPLRVPHMGWNWVRATHTDSLFQGFVEPPRFYFVHSYHVVCGEARDVLATCQYGVEFTCAVQRGSIFGTQFHPEKSHRFGLQVLKSFLSAGVQQC